MGLRKQFEGSGEGDGVGCGGTRISKVSGLSSNVESRIMICLWHTVFEKKRIALSKVPDKSFESEINIKISYNAQTVHISNIF